MVPVTVDVRILTATHHDLRLLVQEGRFREDLYYRINVLRLNLPPLSRRREDIPLLVEHFIGRFNRSPDEIAASFAEGDTTLVDFRSPGSPGHRRFGAERSAQGPERQDPTKAGSSSKEGS